VVLEGSKPELGHSDDVLFLLSFLLLLLHLLLFALFLDFLDLGLISFLIIGLFLGLLIGGLYLAGNNVRSLQEEGSESLLVILELELLQLLLKFLLDLLELALGDFCDGENCQYWVEFGIARAGSQEKQISKSSVGCPQQVSDGNSNLKTHHLFQIAEIKKRRGTYVKIPESTDPALNNLGQRIEVAGIGTDETAQLGLDALESALEVEATASGEIKVELAEVESRLLLVSHSDSSVGLRRALRAVCRRRNKRLKFCFLSPAPESVRKKKSPPGGKS
jgi:hypothetical protein